jgi:hypothetical protein
MKNSTLIFLFFLTIFSGYVVLSSLGKINPNVTLYFSPFDWAIFNYLLAPIFLIAIILIFYSIMRRM